MKNVLVIDGAINCVYDIFQASDELFDKIFGAGEDVAFIDDVLTREDEKLLEPLFADMWSRRIPKSTVMGIHGTLFYECGEKKVFYPTRRDEEAINPDGSRLR